MVGEKLVANVKLIAQCWDCLCDVVAEEAVSVAIQLREPRFDISQTSVSFSPPIVAIRPRKILFPCTSFMGRFVEDLVLGHRNMVECMQSSWIHVLFHLRY